MTTVLLGVELTADSGSDTEVAWRIERLRQVVKYIYATGEVAGCTVMMAKIAKVHDHKGTLTATWKTKPTADEQALVEGAWYSPVGDRSTNVDHQVGAN
ncbi:hypothetical protein GX586_08045 [bacterium]|nr:hypothetical protein [bacterium]